MSSGLPTTTCTPSGSHQFQSSASMDPQHSPFLNSVSHLPEPTQQRPSNLGLHHSPPDSFQPLPGTSSFNRLTYCRPLDANVSPKLKTKIWQGEAIDLVNLLASGYDDPLNQVLGVDDSGQIGFIPVVKNKINSIVQWNEAWRVYSVVFLANPTLSAESKATLGTELFQYMDFINQLYAQQADWRYYDESFRSYRQFHHSPPDSFQPLPGTSSFNRLTYCRPLDANVSPKLKTKIWPFACFDPELKDEAINRARRFDQLKKSQMNTPSTHAKPPSTSNTISQFQNHRNAPSQAIRNEAKSKLAIYDIPGGYCHLFMASMPCYEGTCQYKHCCPFCNAKHPVAQCYRPSYRSNNNRPQPSGFARHQNFRGRGMALMNRNWHNNDLYVAGPGFLNIDKISQFLSNSGPHLYDPVIKGLRHGFSLGYEGPHSNVHMENLKSVTT